MRKWLLRVLGALLVLVLAMALVTWIQVRRVRRHLAVDTPLAVADAIGAGREARRSLEDRIAGQLLAGDSFRLTGAEATLMLQVALRSPNLLGTLRVERQRLVAALARVPDPLGLLSALHLDTLDLKRIRGDVAFEGDLATVRVSAPYGSGPQAGKFLNLVVAGSGRWRAGEVATVSLQRLEVGGLDLLGVVPYGALIRAEVERGLTARTRTVDLRGVTEVTVAEGVWVVTVTPGFPLRPRPLGQAAPPPGPPAAPTPPPPPIPYELPPDEAPAP